jgi:transposase InsO family protein
MIQSLADQGPVRRLCSLLEVSPSGYYQWRKRLPGPRARANQQLLAQVRLAFALSRQTYGSPRLTRQLRRQQIHCGENRVARLMRRHQLQARSKRPFRPRTTDSRHGYGTVPNRLKQTGPLTAINQAWASDITYIHTATGWVYLAAVMDLFSRKIVGWSLGCTLHSSLVKEALQQALADRRPAAGLLHHSDRGSQYASSSYQTLLQTSQIIPSMSSTGNCYDNAKMESFRSTLKTELVHLSAFATARDANNAIGHYIEQFYNPQRLHSALNFNSPVEFEQQLTYKCSSQTQSVRAFGGSTQTKSNQIKPNQTKSNQIKPNQTKSNQINY